MKLYCANCGSPLHLIRKAMPKLGTIVNLISYHECSEDPIPFDFSNLPDLGEFVPIEGKQKFVQSLNKLEPSSIPTFKPKRAETHRGFGGIGTDDLHDRRFDQPSTTAKSTAPSSIAEQIRLMQNSIPANEVRDIQEGNKDDDSVEMGD
jgi:hypothetical protein